MDKKKKRVTMADIAAECGVATMTVSYALSGSPSVSEKTRQVVLETARRLKYEPNLNARRLRSGGSNNTVAIYAPKLLPGTGFARVAYLQAALAEHGYETPITTYAGHTLGKENYSRLLHNLCQQMPAAIIYMAGPHEEDYMEELVAYQERGGLVVSCLRPLPIACDHVNFDHAGAGYTATRYLQELGHQAIAFYGASASGMHRDGYQRAQSEAGLIPEPGWEMTGAAQAEGGAELAQKLLALLNRPTGLVVENDATAAIAVNFLLRAGLRIPEDLSIVAFDDTIMASTCMVPLTAVRQPVHLIAGAVVRLLLDRLKDGYDGAARGETIHGELIVRESARPRSSMKPTTD